MKNRAGRQLLSNAKVRGSLVTIPKALAMMLWVWFCISPAQSEGKLTSVSVCNNTRQIPQLIESEFKILGEEKACGIVFFVLNSDHSVKHLYGFYLYKENIPNEDMNEFQAFVAKFIKKISGHTGYNSTEEDPKFTTSPTGARTFEQRTMATGGDKTYLGGIEIITIRNEKTTENYFIGYSVLGNISSDLYDKFRTWAPK